MSNQNELNAMLAALTEGKAAIEALPAIKRENAELYDMVGSLDEGKRAAEQRIMDLQNKLETVNRALAMSEDELKAATFRETETSSKLETLKALVSGALGAVTEKVEAVVHQVETAQSQINPAPSVEGNGSPHGDVSRSEGDATTISSTSEGQSAVGESVPSTESRMESANTSNVDGPEPVSSDPAKPYAEKGYWAKPHDVTWSDWRSGGGEIAPWMAHDEASGKVEDTHSQF